MEELTDRTAYVKATMADGVCVLEGTTTWCSQCKAIAPFVEQMMKKYPDARYHHLFLLQHSHLLHSDLGRRGQDVMC